MILSKILFPVKSYIILCVWLDTYRMLAYGIGGRHRPMKITIGEDLYCSLYFKDKHH